MSTSLFIVSGGFVHTFSFTDPDPWLSSEVPLLSSRAGLGCRSQAKQNSNVGNFLFMATERFPGGLRRYQNFDQERWERIDFSKFRACLQAGAPHPRSEVADPGGCG